MQAEDRPEGDQPDRQEGERPNGSAPASVEEFSSEEQDNSDENFDESELKDEEEDSELVQSVHQPLASNRERQRLTRTRSSNRQTDIKNYELRKQVTREKTRGTEEKTDRQSRPVPLRRDDEKNLEVYVRIIDYLKKIQWDQTNAQNKMNPYHFMTAQCFWFVICAEYFSFNFFNKKNPEEVASEIMAKVTRINYPLPQRIPKNTLMELPRHYQPPFETDAILKLSEKVTDLLKDIVPTNYYDYYYESSEKATNISETYDDDLFRSSTRALVYNFIKGHYKQRLEGALSVEIPQEEEDNTRPSNEPKEEIVVEEPYLEESDKKFEVENQGDAPIQKEENPALSVNDLKGEPAPQVVTMQAEPIDEQGAQPAVEEKKPSKIRRQLGRQELLLTSIRHMPIEKMISVLAAQLPENRLPVMEEPAIPIPSDPFQLINQTHPLDMQFLEYLKQRRRKENMIEMAEQAQRNLQNASKNKSNANVDATLDDAKCQICTDGDYTEDNLIVFCSTCNISLHQRCVGLMKVPADNWVCDLCLAFGPKGRWLRCPLCTVKGGALKRTTIPSDTQIFKQTNPSYHEYLRGCTHSKNKEEYVPPKTQESAPVGEKPHHHHHHEGKYPHTHPHSTLKPQVPKANQHVVPLFQSEAQQPEKNQVQIEAQGQHADNQQQGAMQEEDSKPLYYNYYNLDEDAAEELPDCHFVWVHYTCAVWVPEVYFQERNGNINVKGVENIDKKRFKIMCEICQTSRTGACIKCAEDDCQLNYHAECARKAGVYMEQRYIDRMQYFIYCNIHKPIKVSRVIQSKNKKYKDEIVKFCRCIEKYVETYKLANVPFKLLKSSKKSGKLKKQGRIRETRQDRESENQDFMKRLKQFLLGNRKLIIQLKKTHDGFRVIDVEEPVKRALRSNITKNDQIWEFFGYRNLSPSQLFKKYKRIMKENAVLRDAFVKEIKTQSKSERRSQRRQNKLANKEYATVDQDPNKPYCLCRKPYLPGELMLECEVCGQWFHFKCIGFVGTEEDGENAEFNCYRCQRYQLPEQIEERRIKFTRFYDPTFVPIIPEEKEEQDISDEDEDRSRQPEVPYQSESVQVPQSQRKPHGQQPVDAPADMAVQSQNPADKAGIEPEPQGKQPGQQTA